MKNIFRCSTLAISLTCLITVAMLLAPKLQADNKAGGCKFGCIPGKIEVATITGENYCTACALKKELGAASACKTYGHRHALKVTAMVDACGEEKPEFIGKTLFYLENDASQELITKHLGAVVSIKGKVYMEVPVIEVASFKLIEAE